jgi:hypothetical protein
MRGSDGSTAPQPGSESIQKAIGIRIDDEISWLLVINLRLLIDDTFYWFLVGGGLSRLLLIDDGLAWLLVGDGLR